MPTPTPAADVAVRDVICAHLRDHPHVTDTETVANALPDQRRHLPDGAIHCRSQHATLLRHSNIKTLLACHGDNGHLVTWRLATLDVHRHLQALHIAGYVHKYPANHLGPDMWLWTPPDLVAHRRIEVNEHYEFFALAQLAGDPGPQR